MPGSTAGGSATGCGGGPIFSIAFSKALYVNGGVLVSLTTAAGSCVLGVEV